MGAAGGGGGTSSPPAPCPSRSPLHRVSSQGRFHFRVQLGGCSEGAWLCRKPFPLLPSAELPRSPLRGIRAAAARRSTKKRQFLMSASVLAAVTQKPPSLRGQSLPEPPPIPAAEARRWQQLSQPPGSFVSRFWRCSPQRAAPLSSRSRKCSVKRPAVNLTLAVLRPGCEEPAVPAEMQLLPRDGRSFPFPVSRTAAAQAEPEPQLLRSEGRCWGGTGPRSRPLEQREGL